MPPTVIWPYPPKAIGPYEILGPLGSSGMGEVYLAKTSTASRVAVKVIGRHLARDPQIRARFMGEVATLRRAFGARVAGFEGADLEADQPWLAVAYVPGLTLRQHVERHGPLPAELGGILGAVLAEGVEAIHKAGLVHRDLKPQNIILARDGPVIIDFGLAMLIDRDEHLTLTGHPVGTPAYMPPEQARGETELTGKADIYALGASLVFALAGHDLYPAVPGRQLMCRITDPDDHPDASGVPAEIAALLGQMLAYTPSARPTATVVKDTLVTIFATANQPTSRLRQTLAQLTFEDTTPPWVDPSS